MKNVHFLKDDLCITPVEFLAMTHVKHFGTALYKAKKNERNLLSIDSSFSKLRKSMDKQDYQEALKISKKMLLKYI